MAIQSIDVVESMLLEIEGLAEGRPGVGTFVTRTLAGASLGNQAALREDLMAWLVRAHRAGLTTDDIVALVDTTLRAAMAERRFQEENV